jgi:hypothetical protein
MKKPKRTYEYAAVQMQIPGRLVQDLWMVMRFEKEGEKDIDAKKIMKRVTKQVAEDAIFRLERNLPLK